MKKCPYCAELIQDEAIKCRHCGELLNTQPRTQASPSKQTAVKQRTGMSLSPMFWLAEVLGVAFLGLEAWQCYSTRGAARGGQAMLAAGAFALLAPLFWLVADALRKFATPTVYFGTGFFDLIGKRFFWMFGPQFIALGGLAFFAHTFIENVTTTGDGAQVLLKTGPSGLESPSPRQETSSSTPVPTPARPIQADQPHAEPKTTDQPESRVKTADVMEKLGARSPATVRIMNATSWTEVDSEVKNHVLSGSSLPHGDRDSAKLNNKAGLAALKSNDYNSAITSFSAALSSDDNDVEARNNLAYAYLLIGKFDAAADQLAQVLEIAPDRASGWANLAEIFGRVGSEDDAYLCLRLTARFSKDRGKLNAFLNNISTTGATLQYQQAATRVLADIGDIPTRAPGEFDPPAALPDTAKDVSSASPPAEAPVIVPINNGQAAGLPPAAQSQQPGAQVPNWYYCPASKTYYPYVTSCPGGWQTVPAQSVVPKQ